MHINYVYVECIYVYAIIYIYIILYIYMYMHYINEYIDNISAIESAQTLHAH